MDLISVIIPVYNIGKSKRKLYFQTAIKSIVNQTYNNIELLLVNDGSTDNSLKILEKWKRRDKRIKIINKTNGGVESARREGIHHAKGQFVIHMDQDDYMRKDGLEILYQHISNENADVVVANAIHFIGIPYGKKSKGEKKLVLNREEFISKYYQGFFGYSIFPVQIWNKLYRKDFLDSILEPPLTGLYNEDLAYNLNVLPQARKIIWISENIYFYRWGGFTTHKINNLLEVALSCYRIKMKKIEELQLWTFKESTSIEFLNYLNSCFYQEIEFEQQKQMSFGKYVKQILSLKETQDAIEVVKNSDYRNEAVEYIIAGDVEGLEKYERKIKVKNKWKIVLKNLLKH